VKKPLMFAAAVAAAVFAGGYVVGQFHSPPTSSAASATKSLAVGSNAVNGKAERWVHGSEGPRAFGQVTAVSGPNNDTVTIKPFIAPRGLELAPTAVALTGSTKYYAGRKSTTTATAVKVGAYIAARGTLSADKKTLTASVVMVLPQAPKHLAFGEHRGLIMRFGRPAAFGKVTAVAGNTVSIKAVAFGWRAPTQVTTIALTGSTKFFGGPFSQVTRSSVKVGSFVAAAGTVSKDGKTLTAARITIMPSELGRHRFMWRHAGDMSGNNTMPGPNL
jgi:Domain of unknown function (DUF5666)